MTAVSSPPRRPSPPARRRRLRLVVMLVAVVALVCATVAVVLSRANAGRWAPEVPEGRTLVANERDDSGGAADRAGTPVSPDWLVTSGSWYADAGAWWTGVPDGRSPDATSSDGTGSAVLRVVSRPAFGDCSVSFDLTLDALVTTPRTPPRDYDGVHVFLRYRGADDLYAISVLRRDGQVAVKRKVASAAGEGAVDDQGYATLATGRAPFSVGRTASVVVTATDVPDGVRLTLTVDGVLLVDVVDDAADGVPPLTGQGRVGLRTDNVEAHVRDLVVDTQVSG